MSAPLCWLASYPKSGNTWMRLALASLRGGGTPVDINGERPSAAYNRFRFDAALDVDSSDLSPDEITDARPAAFRALAEDLDEPTVAKVHEACIRTGNGEPLFPPEVTAGAVYVVRDPRDVAPSLAAHIGASVDGAIAAMNDPEFVMGVLAGGLTPQLPQPLLTWSAHVTSWLDQAPFAVTLIRYEDMLADPKAQLARAAAAFGLTADAGIVAGAVAATRFEVLSRQEGRHGFRERGRSSVQPFFRQGRAGGWRDTLTPSQVARVERDHGAVMHRLGYL